MVLQGEVVWGWFCGKLSSRKCTVRILDSGISYVVSWQILYEYMINDDDPCWWKRIWQPSPSSAHPVVPLRGSFGAGVCGWTEAVMIQRRTNEWTDGWTARNRSWVNRVAMARLNMYMWCLTPLCSLGSDRKWYVSNLPWQFLLVLRLYKNWVRPWKDPLKGKKVVGNVLHVVKMTLHLLSIA